MIRILFILFISLLAGYLFIQGKVQHRETELPVFLREDAIAEAHQTEMEVSLHSVYQPEQPEIEILKTDYKNLWAHLNHLYATNDILAGKEYYTEDFYKHLCNNYKGVQKVNVTRNDLSHHLHIMNWSNDGLVSTIIDSNLVFRYTYADQTERKTVATVAMALLFQGDHWRLDALRILDEKTFINTINN